MKTGIHPQYHVNATVKCMNCGNAWSVGNTQELVEVEICSKCHPFFTGKNVLIDTEGRVDKFKKKMESATGRKKKVRKKTTLEERVNKELSAQFAKENEEKPAKKAEAKPEATPEVAPETEAPAEETNTEEAAE